MRQGAASKDVDRQMDEALAKLEALQGQKLGTGENPLLVSVRSGAKFSMPGMMDTILNLGLNDKSVESLAKRSNNPRFAADSYRRRDVWQRRARDPQVSVRLMSSTRKKSRRRPSSTPNSMPRH